MCLEKRWIRILLTGLLCIGCLILCGCEATAQTAAEVSDAPFSMIRITEAEAEAMCGARTASAVLPTVTAEHADGTAGTVPCAANEEIPTYYLPLDYQTETWDALTLCADGSDIYLVSDEPIADKKTCLAKGTEFSVLMCGEHYFTKAKLIFTGLPMLTISLVTRNGTVTDDTEIGDTMAAMQFSFYDANDPATGTCASFSCNGKIRIRGGTSRSYEKHSFKFSLYKDDGSGETKNVSMCGLRDDDDWILSAMYQEETKVRDMLCYYIWDTYASDAYGDGTVCGTRMRYVELIVGGQYWGLYGLCEPEDAKQFGINEENPGVVYKVGSWTVPSAEQIRRAGRNGEDYVEEVELKYPAEADEDAWEPFADYVETVYESSREYLDSHLLEITDQDNLLSYWIFTNLITGYDNTWKNMYLSYRESDGKIIMVPWDCDISWGLTWNGDTYLHLEHTDNDEERVVLEASRKIISHNLDGSIAKLKAKWTEWKENGLTAENLIAKADEYFALICDTGAKTRNFKRWRRGGDADSLVYLHTRIKGRFAFLDEYIMGMDED